MLFKLWINNNNKCNSNSNSRDLETKALIKSNKASKKLITLRE